MEKFLLSVDSNEPGKPVFNLTMELNAKLTVSGLFLAFLLCACGEDTELPPPDVSQISAPIAVLRFDRALMALDTNDIGGGIERLEADFGEFTDVYLRHIIPLRRGDFSPEEQLIVMKKFLTFPLIGEIDSAVVRQFPDDAIEKQREQLEQALRYYKYYLPEATLPDTMVTFLAQFELAAFLYGDGNLAVGLDFFLGPDFDYQSIDARESIFSNYLSRTYTPEHLTTKALRVLIDDYLDRPRSGRLIDYIIYEGKRLYLLEKVLPGVPDSVIHEVSASQMQWLKGNEIQIYGHLQKEKQLFSTEPDLIRKLTQPAPYSPGMPRESPGQAVNFLGKRIVEAYIRANPKTSMKELLAIEDGQKILAAARYKPK